MDVSTMTDEQLLSVMPPMARDIPRQDKLTYMQLVCFTEYCRRQYLVSGNLKDNLIPELLKRFINIYESSSLLLDQVETFEREFNRINPAS